MWKRLLEWVKRWLGLTDDDAASGAPATPQAGEPLPPVPSAEQLGVLLRREEILDKDGRLAGYRFSLSHTDDQPRPTAQAYLEALRAAKVSALGKRRLVVVVVDMLDWAQEDFSPLRSQNLVFQIDPPEDLQQVNAWLGLFKRLRRMGAGVGFANVQGGPDFSPALLLSTHVFVDFSKLPVEALEKWVKLLRVQYRSMKLVVERVSTWPERRLCVSLGAEYAMGDFLTSYEKQEGNGKLSEGRLVLMEMLNTVRNDGEAKELAELAKRDPGISVKLLAMANSPAYGLAKPLTGIEQAIMVLGRNVLYRWLAISVFRIGNDHTRDEALLEVALARARFLELAALSVNAKPQADELFLVGLLSFADTLLGVPMADLVKTMALPEAVQDVLLRSEGPHARYLILAIAMEKCLAQRAAQLAGELGLPVESLNEFRNAAVLWAEQAVK